MSTIPDFSENREPDQTDRRPELAMDSEGDWPPRLKTEIEDPKVRERFEILCLRTGSRPGVFLTSEGTVAQIAEKMRAIYGDSEEKAAMSAAALQAGIDHGYLVMKSCPEGFQLTKTRKLVELGRRQVADYLQRMYELSQKLGTSIPDPNNVPRIPPRR
ncbi:hypothetical protein KBB27_01330 [Patescibacteria group bacterium]|nr:hypothetical protein [Patescibacteria group bacterium]